MAYTNVWSNSVPTGAEAANTIDDIFRSLKLDITERFDDLFAMPAFTADPLRPYGLKFTDAQDAVVNLGDNGGTPRSLLVKDKTGTNTYFTFNSTQFISTVQTTKLNNNQTLNSFIQIGPDTPNANRFARTTYLFSNAVKNWRVGFNDLVGASMDITPSTAVGGSTFTTPALQLSDTGNLTPTGSVFLGTQGGAYYGKRTSDGVQIPLMSVPAATNDLTFTTPGATFIKDTGVATLLSLSAAGALSVPSTVTGTDIFAAAGSAHRWSGRSMLSSPSDGRITLFNNTQSGFDLLQFGGTTPSFPAIKRNAFAFDLRLADDSGYASLATNNLFVNGALQVIGKLGYINGAGGTVTQLSDRLTAVTINKPCGTIITSTNNSTGLGGTFTVNNNQVAATDTIVLNIASQTGGNTPPTYGVSAVAAGSFRITYSSAPGDPGAVTFNFAILSSINS